MQLKTVLAKLWLIAKHSIGLFLATFFAGTGVGAIVTDGNWMMGSLIGVGTAFAGVLTYIGVSLSWSGQLSDQSIVNAFRTAVAKNENEDVQDALKVEKDGSFDFDDAARYLDEDPEITE
jgi:hypothetical protein